MESWLFSSFLSIVCSSGLRSRYWLRLSGFVCFHGKIYKHTRQYISDVTYGANVKALAVFPYNEGAKSNDRISASLNAASGDKLELPEGSVYGFCKKLAKDARTSIHHLEDDKKRFQRMGVMLWKRESIRFIFLLWSCWHLAYSFWHCLHSCLRFVSSLT